MPNLIEALQDEIKRNQELVKAYATVPTGIYAQKMIELNIKIAEKAITAMDTVSMVKSLAALRSNNL